MPQMRESKVCLTEIPDAIRRFLADSRIAGRIFPLGGKGGIFVKNYTVVSYSLRRQRTATKKVMGAHCDCFGHVSRRLTHTSGSSHLPRQ